MKRKTILIFAYYSFRDPVFQSAVLPYFQQFPDRERFRFILQTFEQGNFEMETAEQKQVARELASEGIIWIPKIWHSGTLKIIKKVYDLIVGVSSSVRLIRKYKAVAIYSEGFPGGVIAHFVARLTGRPHIIHTFEPHTDYMIESGVWKKSDWEARLLRRYEGVVARGAYAILTATQAMIDKWSRQTRARMFRVPSCVDLGHFNFDTSGREAVRKAHQIGDHELVMVYLGKLGGMYMGQELFDLFKEAYRLASPGQVMRFMVLSTEPREKIDAYIKKSGIPDDRFIVRSLVRSEVPAYLSAAELAVCGIRPIPARQYSSPIKNGEYWACGLPVIIPDGISDDYLRVEPHQLGWRLSGLTNEDYAHTLQKVFREWTWEKQPFYRLQTRKFVEQDRNVRKFQELYSRIFSQL